MIVYDSPELRVAWYKNFLKMIMAGAGENQTHCLSVGARQTLFQICRAVGAKRVLDLGTCMGVSALTLAVAVGPGGQVVTVDIVDVNADGWLWDTKDVVSGRPSELMRCAGVADRVVFVQSCAADFLLGGTDLFDLAFLDASHSPGETYRELLGCLDRVKPGGLVVMDDVFVDNQPIDPGGWSIAGPWLALEALKLARPGTEYQLIGANIDGSPTRMALLVVPDVDVAE